MTNPEELHALVDELPEEARDEARVVLLALARGLGDELTSAQLDTYGRTGDDVLTEILADAALRAKFFARLDRIEADARAGKAMDGETFMAQMRERSRRRLAGE